MFSTIDKNEIVAKKISKIQNVVQGFLNKTALTVFGLKQPIKNQEVRRPVLPEAHALEVNRLAWSLA